MITVKVPNVLDKDALAKVLQLVDVKALPLIMEPDGDITSDDYIGEVTQVVDLGVDFEVVVELYEPHRFVATSVFIFFQDLLSDRMYLVQKEPWVRQTPN